MSLNKIIKDDVAKMKLYFPKLQLQNSDGRPPSFAGHLDICDAKGDWHGSFDVILISPGTYPYGVPCLFETGGLIERIADRHINGDGSCCVGIDHKLLYLASRGLTMNAYMQEFGYPYFANQLYFKQTGHYAAGEYSHGFAGVLQFYRESLDITNAAHAAALLVGLLEGNLPLRNELCFCGSNKKYKCCHLKAVEYLEAIDRIRLLKDLSGFDQLGKK